jgi:hypothetical protein
MATILVAGQQFDLPDARVESLRRDLSALEPGQFVELRLVGDVGQTVWVKIPAESPVAIIQD